MSITTTTTTTTTQPPYSSDDDLLEVRSNIISLGVAEWQLTHYKARDIINRDIDALWYRDASVLEGVDHRETPFSPPRMLNWLLQVKDLSVYKVFELIYLYLSKDVAEDNFLLLSDRYAEKYEKELKRIIKAGIDYDWDADNVIDLDEASYQRHTRRISRV